MRVTRSGTAAYGFAWKRAFVQSASGNGAVPPRQSPALGLHMSTRLTLKQRYFVAHTPGDQRSGLHTPDRTPHTARVYSPDAPD